MPIKMKLKISNMYEEQDVMVYDFHYTSDGDPMALCWLMNAKSWYSTPVGFLTPYEEKKHLCECKHPKT